MRSSYTKLKQILSLALLGTLIFGGMSIYTMQHRDLQMVISYDFFTWGTVPQDCKLVLVKDGETYIIDPIMPVDDYNLSMCGEIVYNIPDDLDNIDMFMLELAHNCTYAKVKSISFWNCGTQIVRYSSFDIEDLFYPSGFYDNISYEELDVRGDNEELIILYGSDAFIEEFNSFRNVVFPAISNCILFAIVITIICAWIKHEYTAQNSMAKQERIKWDKQDWLLLLGLSAIFITATVIAVFSKHYAHPDENVSRMAVDYFSGQWLYPDIHSSWAAGTLSDYGVSRLGENTFYYLVAGKIGWIFKYFFHMRSYYRLSNIVCLAIILLLCWIKRKSHKWIALAICLAPQSWYLFSYATSDAWDLFCGFIIVYLLLESNSILWKAIDTAPKGKRVLLLFYSAGCAFIFAQILLGKSNYLLILGIAFGDLLIYWLKNEHKARRIIKYFLILVMTFIISFGIKSLPRISDVYTHSETVGLMMQKNMEERNSVKNNYYDEMYTGNVEKYSSLAEQGYSFKEMLWSYADYPTLYRMYYMALGLYQWGSVHAGNIYTAIFAMLHFGCLIVYLKNLFRDCNWENVFQTIYNTCLILGLIVVQLLYCYYVTYQTQGRYLLPIILSVGYMCTKNKKIWGSRTFVVLQYLCMFLGLYSFIFVGARSFFIN